MTTNDFDTAARESAAGDHPDHRNALPGDAVLDIMHAHVEGWKAARTYLAAQEPTDAEVDAVAASILWKTSGRHWEDISDGERREYREYARAALSAARAVRRDEEKQDG